MRKEYQKNNKQLCIMLPSFEKDELIALLNERNLTQAQFIRGSFWLLKSGQFENFFKIYKNDKENYHD